MREFKRGGQHNDHRSKGFRDRQSGSPDFHHGGSGFRPAKFKAICAECGRECEVPFKPSGDRPVYCSNCFKNKANGRPGQANDHSFSKPSFSKPGFSGGQPSSATGEQLEKLNKKLDQILNILNAITIEEEDESEDEMAEEEPIVIKPVKPSQTAKTAKPSNAPKAGKKKAKKK